MAKGIQFLHDGIIPGLFANNLNSTNVLIDQNSVAKIDSYNLSLFSFDREFEVNLFMVYVFFVLTSLILWFSVFNIKIGPWQQHQRME